MTDGIISVFFSDTPERASMIIKVWHVSGRLVLDRDSTNGCTMPLVFQILI